VTDTSIRADRVRATRAQIAETALELFQSQGFAETTIDQIAEAAGVGRRTVFRHFPTKDAMLLDHLVLRREEAIARLAERPASEPPLTSLHTVLRQLCEEGYDRRLLGQIRAVLSMQPGRFGEELTVGSTGFATSAIAALLAREGNTCSSIEIHALTLTAMAWFVTAAHCYLTENRPSLVACFDEVVALSVHAAASTFG